MSELQTLQSKMATAMQAGHIAELAKDFTAGAADAGRRLMIYQNNSFGSLTAALKSVFPVTVELGDARFFDYAAHHYILKHPPREPRLSLFGAGFPKFLTRFPASREAPLLAAMASLEWCLASSLNDAAEAPAPLTLMDNAGTDGGRVCLRLQPNLRFVLTRWPLTGLWAHHTHNARMPEAPLPRQLSRVAVFRSGEDVELANLDSARFTFWRMLAKGLTLETAAARALARDPLFDLVQDVLLLFRNGLVTGVYATLPHH